MSDALLLVEYTKEFCFLGAVDRKGLVLVGFGFILVFMNWHTWMIGLLALSIAALTSCGSVPPPKRDLGPKSEHSSKPWNTMQPGEGQGPLGGIGTR